MTRVALATALAAAVVAASPRAQTSTPAPSARFLALFERYRSGDFNAPVDAFSRWRDADVWKESQLGSVSDVWTRAALALFHTEAGMRRGSFGKWAEGTPEALTVGGWGLEKHFEAHAFLAQAIVRELIKVAHSTGDDRLFSWCRQWFISAVSYSIRAKADYATEGLYAIANHEFSEEPEVRLLIGSMAEANAGPFQPTPAFRCGLPSYFLGPDGCVLIAPAKGDTRVPKGEQEALWAFRSALKMDPSLIEARMRLGRMLYLVGQMAEARSQLEQSLAEATDEKITFIAYLSALFLGELEEHEGHMTTAIARYREAVKLEPGAHTANVALGGALLRAGYKNAWIEARRMFDGESLRSPAPRDPWVFYRYSQFYKVAADLRAMREAVRPALHERP